MYQGQKVTAILLAAGSGTRFGAKGNKVYVEANGKPILQYSLDILDAHPYVDERILVVKDGEQELAEHLTCENPFRIVVGGNTRQESVYHGLQAAHGEIVLIHDSARPVFRGSYITRCVETMSDFPGATMAVRSKDTIKLSDERGVVTQTTDRAHTWIIQTPQCFQRNILLAAHEQHKGDPKVTDDCMLLELSGYDVKLVEGDYTNIKVTTAEDLALAETFLQIGNP